MELDISMFGEEEFEENQSLIGGSLPDEDSNDDDTSGDGSDDTGAEGGEEGDDGEGDDDISNPDSDDDSGNSDDDSSDKDTKLVYNNIANLLIEEGLITDEELKAENVGDSEALVEAFRNEIKRNEYADLSETQRDYLTAIREGIPEDIFLRNKQAEQSYDAITDTMVAENDELRKNIILADLTSKNINPGRAEKLYKAMVDAGDDVEEAMTSLQSLKDTQKANYQKQVDAIKERQDNAKRLEQERFNNLKKSIYETKEIIKDYKITDKLRDQVYNDMTKPVAYNENGQPVSKYTHYREKDPVGFDTKLNYLLTMTKGLSDFSVFEKKAQSKAAKKLEQVVSQTSSLKTGSVPTPGLEDNDQTDVPTIVKLDD